MNKQELIKQYGEFLSAHNLTPDQAVVGGGWDPMRPRGEG